MHFLAASVVVLEGDRLVHAHIRIVDLWLTRAQQLPTDLQILQALAHTEAHQCSSHKSMSCAPSGATYASIWVSNFKEEGFGGAAHRSEDSHPARSSKIRDVQKEE